MVLLMFEGSTGYCLRIVFVAANHPLTRFSDTRKAVAYCGASGSQSLEATTTAAIITDMTTILLLRMTVGQDHQVF